MDKVSWKHIARGAAELSGLNASLVFHRKAWMMAAGVVVYYGILYAVAVFRPDEGFGSAQALFVLVEIPGTVLAIYLVMDLVSSEREGDTLELLFTVSASHYVVWLSRMLVVYAVLVAALLGLSGLSYVLFAELPVLRGGLNACLPSLLMANLTLCLAVWFRSGNTAGMLAAAGLLLALMTYEAAAGTAFALFLNPFDPPVGVDVYAWAETVWINRLSVGGLAVLLLFAALRVMEKRERLLN